jgi:hypothetical protein
VRYLVILFLLTGCPMPKPCLPGDAVCPPTPSMEQSCKDVGGQLEQIICGEDSTLAWACCDAWRGCVCFQVE